MLVLTRRTNAHDAYRLLVATDSATLAATPRERKENELAGGATRDASTYLDELLARGPGAPGVTMAGSAERLVGVPETVSDSASILAADLLARV
jgi:hypothetical protein